MKVATVVLAALVGCGSSTSSSTGARDAAVDVGSPSLVVSCLPRCILALFAECPFDAPCTATSREGGADLCYDDGVRVRVQDAADAGVVWTYYATNGQPCARKTVQGNVISYERLRDGERATLLAVSRDLRTATCGGDEYTGVYPVPSCRALETVGCRAGACRAP